MQFPIINANSNPKGVTSQFYGLNRKDIITEGEFSSMKNLSSEHYPCLSPRPSRAELVIDETITGIQAIISPKYYNGAIGGFTGIANGKFYYKDFVCEFEDTDMYIDPEDTEICLVDFNGYILIVPYMYYFSYRPTDTGDVDYTVHYMAKGKNSVDVTLFSSYVENASGTTYTNYFMTDLVDFDWSDYFTVNDVITFSGFTDVLARNNTIIVESNYTKYGDDVPISVIVKKIDGRYLYFEIRNQNYDRLLLKDGDGAYDIANGNAATVTVRKAIPTFNWVCVHSNRVWGTISNGEALYASALGDPFSFYTIENLSTDCVRIPVGTAAGFIGICAYRDNVVAFKKDFIHHIYGDKPTNFSAQKQITGCGCIDIKSAVEIEGVLFYLGYNGFYVYTGGQPELISDKLNKKYESATAFSDGIKYYASAVDEDGNVELLVYDTRYNVWHIEDDLKVVSSLRWHNNIYAATVDKVYRFNYGSENVSFEAITGRITEGLFDQKGINEIFIRAELEKNSKLSIYKSINDEPYKECGSAITESGFKVHRIPVMLKQGDYYRLKIVGNGGVVLHAIERTVSKGGRNYAT